ncbi:hypothetical protein [Actinopolymorpha pittospori]|uniref:Uncharacterized protein n=1 Tax=Actinopolymorpha pittospori TaxID=648752 RepID=A0A927MSM0_9ACTN|nr:hypothetical protein [Actinopolymorpha pittospori]MBE1605557.1 hypothetical protein [Actinopolymorpha pittospori]
MARLRQEFEYPAIVGAYTAAEWALELTDVRPMARAGLTSADVERLAVQENPALVHAADQAALADELRLAVDVLEGHRAGDQTLALGVHSWLAWWLGVRDLPEQFVPGSEPFDQLLAR